jgi:hypothetical protein
MSISFSFKNQIAALLVDNGEPGGFKSQVLTDDGQRNAVGKINLARILFKSEGIVFLCGIGNILVETTG